MAGNTSTAGATAASRVMAVLGTFDERHPRQHLSQIARRADVPLATTHRLCAELVRLGALAKVGNEFVVGRRLWDVGLLAPVETPLREAASPFLHDIYAATRATVHLAVRDDLEVLYVERLAGRASVPVVSTVGSTLPLHATGVGKVLMAHAPPDVVDRALTLLAPMTTHTITDAAELAGQLEVVRRDGYATTEEEMTLGACSVAAPIRRHSEVVAALGVVVPTLRRGKGQLVAALQVAARGISRQLG